MHVYLDDCFMDTDEELFADLPKQHLDQRFVHTAAL